MDEHPDINITAPLNEINRDKMEPALLPYITDFKRDALLKERVAITDNILLDFDQNEFRHLNDATTKIKVPENMKTNKWHRVFTEIGKSDDLVKDVWKYIQETDVGRQNKALRNVIYKHYVESGETRLKDSYPDEHIDKKKLEKVMGELEEKDYNDNDVLQCAQHQVVKLQSQITIHEQAFAAITAVCGDTQIAQSDTILAKEWDDLTVQKATDAVCDIVDKLKKMSSEQTKAKQLAEDLEINKQKLQQAHRNLEQEKSAHGDTAEQLEKECARRRSEVSSLIETNENHMKSMQRTFREDLMKVVDDKNNEHKTEIANLLEQSNETLSTMQEKFQTQMETEQKNHRLSIKNIHKKYKDDKFKRDKEVQDKDKLVIKEINKLHETMKGDLKHHQKGQKDALERLHTRVVAMRPKLLEPKEFQMNLPTQGSYGAYPKPGTGLLPRK